MSGPARVVRGRGGASETCPEAERGKVPIQPGQMSVFVSVPAYGLTLRPMLTSSSILSGSQARRGIGYLCRRNLFSLENLVGELTFRGLHCCVILGVFLRDLTN